MLVENEPVIQLESEGPQDWKALHHSSGRTWQDGSQHRDNAMSLSDQTVHVYADVVAFVKLPCNHK